MKRPLHYSNKLPIRSVFPDETVLFYDSILASKPTFRIWLNDFKYKVPLKSGEQLKTLASFQKVLNKILDAQVPQSTELSFVAVGGGSVGDFVGFVASIYLRGRKLIHIPSTWLAAVDSAHGGKNGLNFKKTKNQIGTFHLPEKIYVVKDLLLTQSPARLKEAMGEIIKTAVLFDSSLFAELENNPQKITQENIFKKLPRLIEHKYKVVEQDPHEKKGLRRLLNLGHTMGHVFESYYGWPHGVCVLLGLQFSARWSFHKKILSEKDFVRISTLIDLMNLEQSLDMALLNMPPKKIISLLQKDKKLTSASVLDFIFIKKIGKAVRAKVTLEDILAEASRQKEN